MTQVTFPNGANVGVMNFNGKFVNILNREFIWSPLPDITVYELALCAPIFGMVNSGAILGILELPDNARRHFVEVTK